MKILMATMGLDIGGAETHIVELARELARRGHEVLVASNGGVYISRLEEAGVRHVQIPMHRRSPLAMGRSYLALKRLIKTERPDLVHSHARIPGFLCGRLQKRLGFPFITTAHWVFQADGLAGRLTDWGERTVAVSEDIKTYLMENYGVPEEDITVTINGIDTETYAPRDGASVRRTLGISDDQFVVCHVSRLDSSRSLAAETLVASAETLCARHPDLTLLIVGDGDRYVYLRDQADQVNRILGRQGVVLTGSRSDIPDLLNVGDCFVGVSRAALEAMSAGLPVILAGNEGFLGQFSEDKLPVAEKSNFCCRDCAELTAEGLEQALESLMALPAEERDALGAQGRQVILAGYSAAKMTEDYLSAYDHLLHDPEPIPAVISGYYGYHNLGDDAILMTIRNQLSALDPPVRLTVLSRHPRQTSLRFRVKAVRRFSPVSVYRALKRSSLLISGGGSMLQDRTSTRSLQYYLGVIRLARRMGKPVFLYANGIGPVTRPSNRRAVCRTVEDCTAVTLRDRDSLEDLRSMGVARLDLWVTGDPTFAMEPGTGGLQRLSALGLPKDRGVIGVSLRPVSGVKTDPAEYAALCDRMARETKRSILFLVMQDPEDKILADRIAERMTEPSWQLETPGDPETMLGIVGCLDAVVSMRLHTILFAARQRVPVVGCVYDPKVDSFLKLLDMPSCGTPDALDPERAAAAVKDLLARRDEVRAELDRRVREMERGALETCRLLRETLRQEGIIS